MPLDASGHPSEPEQSPQNLLRALARKHTERAVQSLADVLADEEASAGAKISAAKALLDFGWKKSENGDGDSADDPVKFAAQNWADSANNNPAV